MDKLPFWAMYESYKLEDLEQPVEQCAGLLAEARGSDLETADPTALAKLVSCCHRYHTTRSSNPSLALSLLSSLISFLCEMLCAPALEKRVSGVVALSKLVDRLPEETPAFRADFKKTVEKLKAINWIFTPLHAEVAGRAQAFFTWAVRSDLVPTDIVSSLWASLLESHETTKASIIDLFVKSIPYAYPSLLDTIAAELQQTPFSSFDDQFLRFLQRCVLELGASEGGRGLVEVVLRRLEDQQFEQRRSQIANEIIASLLTKPIFFDTAVEHFQLHLNEAKAASHSLKSIEFLALFVREMEKSEIGLENFTSSKSEFVDICVKGLQAAIALSPEEATSRIQAWIKCIDNAAKLYRGVGENPYLTTAQLKRIWTVFVSPPFSYQSLLFCFFADSQSSWLNRRTLGPLIESLEPQSIKPFNILPAIVNCRDWLSRISASDFEGLYSLIIKGSVDRVEDSGLFVYERVRQTGIFLLTVCSFLADSSDVRKLSTQRLIHFHMFVNMSNSIQWSLIVIFTTISTLPINARVLELLDTLLNQETKYKESLWHEEDMEEMIAEVERKKPPWLQLLGSSPREQLADQITEHAHSAQVPYNFIYFIHGSESRLPSMVAKKFNPLRLELLDSTFGFNMIRLLFKRAGPGEARVAWALLTKVLTRRQFLGQFRNNTEYYVRFREDLTLSSRLVWLQAVSLLSEEAQFKQWFGARREELRTVFEYISLEEFVEELVRHFTFKLLAYCELVVRLMSQYYWQAGDTAGDADLMRVLDILLAVASYYRLPEADPSATTDLFSSAVPLFHLFTDYDWQPLSTKLSDLLRKTLLDCKVSPFAKESVSFWDSVTAGNYLLTGEVVRFCEENGEAEFRRGGEDMFVLKLLGKVLGRGDAEIPQSEFLQNLPSFVFDQDFFWLQPIPVRCTLLNLISSLQTTYSQDTKRSIVDTLLGWFFSYHKRYMDANTPGGSTMNAGLEVLLAMGRNDTDLQEHVQQAFSGFYRNMAWRKRATKYWNLAFTPGLVKPYIGITNLGATCYMSAILQQLQTIDSFIDALFSVETTDSAPFLSSLVSLFARLKFKHRGAVSPAVLISTMDAAIDKGEQMDIEEFFDMLMHKIDASLSETSQSRLISEHFKGRLKTTLSCQRCGNTRELSHDFLTLTLAIKGKKTLKESLEAMIRGELMGGDNAIECETCKTAEKTESIQQIQVLPKVLICSLRRFEYDIQKAQRRKINDKFEFPQEIDFKPYCVDQTFPEDYYQYTLRGIVIHTGLAEAGHYYSLAKINGKWMRFDDTNVEPDVSDIETESFGSQSTSYGRSAYLLVYNRERIYSCSDDPEPFPSIDYPRSSAVSALCQQLNEKLCQQWQLQMLLSPLLAKYMVRVLEFPSLSPSNLRFVISFFLTIHCRKAAWTDDPQFLRLLLDSLRANNNSSTWVLEVLSHAGIIEEFLTGCPTVAGKKAFVLILKEAAREGPVRKCLIRFVNKINQLPDVASRDYAQLFEALLMLVSRAPDVATELRLNEFLISRLFRYREDFPDPPFVSFTFTAEGYLGHPCDEYEAVKQTSNETHIGFQLMIANKLMREGMEESLLRAIEPDGVWLKMKLETYFERKQLGLFLFSCYRVLPQLIHQMMSYWLGAIYFPNSESVNQFFDIAHALITPTDGELINYLLGLLFPDKLSRSYVEDTAVAWVTHLYRLYRLFPQDEAWDSLYFLQGLESWVDVEMTEEARARFQIMVNRVQTNLPASAPGPEDMYNRSLMQGAGLLITHNKQKKVGRLETTFEIVHVVKIANVTRLVWVAGEEDIIST